ncbi:patatin-domain-containing protein [Hysterangium stoloniferum]|nr:patatin-domain-containing protein [Hysterangium stoloniferum]
MSQPEATDIFTTNYANEEHLQAFNAALSGEDPEMDVESSPASPNIFRARVHKVAALSDFAPINVTIPRRRRAKIPKKRQDRMFHIIRWPLLISLFAYIYGIFGLYVLVRQVVNAIEWMFAWRGQKGILRKRLRAAQSYEEWKSAAEIMDTFLGFGEWKKEDRDPYYDWALVHKVRRSLRSLREKNDARGVLGVLETCIRANFAGTESARLYSETHYGTKNCIEEYITEVISALQYIRKTPLLQQEEKRRFFRSANRNLGSSALCLSGGGSFGYYHVGVVRALLDANLLPRVVAGTSAGGLIAALVCTRSDEELRQLLVPRLANKITACEEPFRIWIRRFMRTGARFDTVQWARKASFFTRGSLTFREAYRLTGRVLNISVIPFDRHSPTKLLNYLTAPDCVIWSALLASAAVPGILNPVVLMQKDKTGRLIPWNWGSRFRDVTQPPVQWFVASAVSLRLEHRSLALFLVNNPIVSQVNPHVHLWHFGPRGTAGKPVAHRKGKGWRGGFILSAAEQWLKLELTKNFKFMRDLELLPTLLGQDWTSVFLQRYDGSVTIWPRTKVSDWFHILSDPSPEQLEEMMKVGKRVTWPKIHIIENRSKLEREIIRGRQGARQPTSRDRPTQDNLLPRHLKASRDVSPSSAAVTKGNTPFPNDLPIESDAEASFEKGSPRFFKRQHRRSRGVSPSADKYQDAGAQYGLRTATPDASSFHSPTQIRSRSRSPPAQSSSFFSRLHRRSLASIPTSFGGFRKSDPNLQLQSRDDGAWSSDSSSSDYPLDEVEARARHPSLLLNPLEGVQGFKENYPALDDKMGDDNDYGMQE